MSATVVNYDGSITAHPQQLVRPQSVEDLQTILRDVRRYPGPVRAKGSYHSLTPCASSDGTIIDMSGMQDVIAVGQKAMTFTAQAGLQWIDADG
jgi:FAD/FMN-containing dehydrogenase